MNAAEKWGLPNWQDASAYPAPDDLSSRQWWWEFTRRRPDYRALWDGSEKRDYSHDTVLAADPDWLRIHFEMSRLLDPTKSYSDWRLIQAYYPKNAIYPPAEPSAWDDDHVHIFRDMHELRRHQAQVQEKANIVDFRFDLSAPLAPQLEMADRQLKAQQREMFGVLPTPKHRKTNWPIFLRCLDARDCKATYAAMSEAIWPGQNKTAQSARDSYNAACELRDKLQNNSQ